MTPDHFEEYQYLLMFTGEPWMHATSWHALSFSLDLSWAGLMWLTATQRPPCGSLFICHRRHNCHFPFRGLLFLLTPPSCSCYCAWRSGRGLWLSLRHWFFLKMEPFGSLWTDSSMTPLLVPEWTLGGNRAILSGVFRHDSRLCNTPLVTF